MTNAEPYRHRFPMTIIQHAIWLYHGVIQASRFEVRTPQQRQQLHLDDAQVAGRVSALDSAAKTFVVNGVTVAYGSATLQGDALAVGSGVEVRGQYDDATHQLNAVRVGVHGGSAHQVHLPPVGAQVKIEGEITAVDPAAYTLSLGGAVITGTPAVGAEVHLSGTVDAKTATVIHAKTVSISEAEEHRFEGVLSHLASGGNFDLGALHVDVSRAKASGTPANGLPVVVFGPLTAEGRTLLAVRVLGPQLRTLSGTVRDLNTTASTFRLGDARVNFLQAKVSGTLKNAAAVTVNGTVGESTEGRPILNAATVTVQ